MSRGFRVTDEKIMLKTFGLVTPLLVALLAGAASARAQAPGTIAPARLHKSAVVTGQYVAAFDGVDDKFDATDSGLPSGTSSRAIAFWVKPDTLATGSYQTIFGYGTYSATHYIGAYINPAGNLMVSQYGLSGVWSLPTGGNWMHVVINIAPPVFSVYVNGSVVGSDVSMTVDTTLSGHLYYAYEQPTNTLFLAGRMADLRVYAATLSAGEVTALYNSGSVTCAAVAPTSLVRWYQMREATGTNVRDVSASEDHATLSNGPTRVSDSLQCP